MDDPTWTLVHGVIRKQIGEHSFRIAHGWLKRDGWVYDAVLNKSYNAEEYLSIFAAEEIAAFSPFDAAERALETRCWGPWAAYDATVIGASGMGKPLALIAIRK